MAELEIAVIGAEAERFAAVPTLTFKLRVTEASGEPVHAVALRAQIRIEPKQRHYTGIEEERLEDLFGEPSRWGETLHPFLWGHVATTVQGFEGQTDVDLPMVCTYDFEVAASKYLHALEDGAIPVVLLFSGTVFTKGAKGFAAQPVPWHLESHYRLPVSVWRDVMDRFFPNSGWIRLARETIDDLQRFRTERALPTWEQTIEVLLKEADR
jgi:Family of unknown function (DUF6084)